MEFQPEDLIGRWSLRRRVADRATGLVGTVHGTLQIAGDGDGLRWAEAGRFSWQLPGGLAGTWLPARSAPVSRALRLTAIAGAWWMQFADGRPFHPWRPGQPVDHPCAADHYRGLVLIDSDGHRMRTIWDVTGPAKDQRLVTRLTR